MDILFANDRTMKLINEERRLKREYGADGAKLIARRMYDLKAAASLKDVALLPGRCEELRGNRKGQVSLRLHGGHRLVFEAADEPLPRRPDGGLDWAAVRRIRILEIVNYHD